MDEIETRDAATHVTSTTTTTHAATHAAIRPWADPVVDERGHDPRSAYVERYWLSVIGPTNIGL